VPTNHFVLLSGTQGSRHRELQTELLWRTLNRGQPAIIISMVDPLVAIVEEFLELDWYVLPYLDAGQLQIVDCFTSRLREGHQSPNRLIDWNQHLKGRIDPIVERVEDATDMPAIENRLFAAIDTVDIAGTGIVVIDSLNELEIQGQRLQASQFLQEIRAEVSKRLFVPIFASATMSAEKAYSLKHSCFFDGIIDMRRNESVVADMRLKQLSIRKMDGASYLPHWVAYENFGDGFVSFDPNHAQSVYQSPSRPAAESR